jgi:tRNA threonylcarbamoyl adenosine modification protein YeaZ
VLVLALDTSTPTVTAGVVELRRPHEIIAALQAGTAMGDEATRPAVLLAERSVTDPFAHAERLMPLAIQALTATGRTLADVEAVVVGLGPGPFTGLRVGIATAAALGDGLGVPVHGVPSHDGTARALQSPAPRPAAGELLVVTDARRREVYLSVYRADGARVLGPQVVAPAAVPQLLAEQGLRPTHLTGAGRALLEPFRGDGFDPEQLDTQAAAQSLGLAERAATALLTGAVPGPLTPLYLRRPDATEPGARKSVLGR